MTRTMIGAATMATVIVSLGTAALAQDRGSLRERIRARMAQDQSTPGDPNPTRITTPGDYRFTFTHQGIKRDYLVHVPARLLKVPAPIVMALHGGGGGMNFQAKNYGLTEKSDAAGFIAVFPNGYSSFPGGMLATWNAGMCCGKARDNKVDDVGFLKEVIARVVRQTNGDAARVFVTGMSNGGMMAYRLACEAPEMIRAIAPVAGTDNTASCAPSRPTPLIHFHAHDDSHVLFNGGAGKDAFRNRAAVTEFTAVPATIAKWVKLNRANPIATTVLTVPGVRCDRHPAAKNGAPVELCVTDSGGHSWPGVTSGRPGKQPSQAISANDLMWAFFQSV